MSQFNKKRCLALMYRLLDVYCPHATIVSVAHRLYLKEFHTRELDLD